jgi:hypothetical protein
MFGSTERFAQHALKFRPHLLALLAVGLAGCAQMQQAGYYNPPPASTTTDAIAQGDGIYNNQTLRAPSQIQIGLQQPSPVSAIAVAATDTSSSVVAAPTESLQATLIPEPQTFAGTLPCFHPEMKCSAQRVTITLAPNGRWRARATYLEQNSKNSNVQTDQGCWRASAQAVPRVVLLNGQGNVRAELAMTSGDVLRLISMNGSAANLTYNLSRQPDLDSIDELKGKPAPNCP